MTQPDRPDIVFTSRYGSARRYALLLAERLQTVAVDLGASRFEPTATPLIVIAPIYAGRLLKLRALRRVVAGSRGPVALAVVGLTDIDHENRSPVADSIKAATNASVPVFNLRGDYRPAELSFVHRMMMKMMKSQLRKDPGLGQQSGAREIVEDLPFDGVDPAALEPLARWAEQH